MPKYVRVGFLNFKSKNQRKIIKATEIIDRLGKKKQEAASALPRTMAPLSTTRDSRKKNGNIL